MSNLEENKQLVVSLVENMFDVDAFDAATSEDFERVIESHPSVHPRAGSHDKAATLERLRDLGGANRDLKVTVKGVIAEDDRVAVEFAIAGRRPEEPDEESYTRCHWMFEVRDGKVVLLKEYVDTAYSLALHGELHLPA